MVLVVDNYDSFTYNLVQYLGEMTEVKVYRNDKINIDKILTLKPDHIIISPGPGRPETAGQSNNIIREFKNKIPILGVCLGHQCIGSVFECEINRASNIFHGKTSDILIEESKPLFNNLSSSFKATRYHSLIINPESIPDSLKITAKTDQGEIMGIQHRELPVYGVQFHPESILTEMGKNILKNFISIQ